MTEVTSFHTAEKYIKELEEKLENAEKKITLLEEQLKKYL